MGELCLKMQLKRFMPLVLIFSLLIGFVPPLEVFAESTQTTEEQFQVSPGVNYRDVRLDDNAMKQVIRVTEIDLTDPYTKVKVGIPNSITKLATTSSIARLASYENYNVVGAINASFYHYDNRLPAYLLAEKNKIVNFGTISTKFDEYMSVPTAFGITEDGSPLIDRFQYEASFEINGSETEISSINKQRQGNEIILYTPTYSFESTMTNSIGMEIVVTNTSKQIDGEVEFGEMVTGTVQEISPYGTGNTPIPKDGFVISIQGGEQSDTYADVQVGQEIQVNVGISDQWKNAEFMLASGPMLVDNGKVELTIDENSSRAKERAPRTAVAIDDEKNKVFFVTVDGRQSDYSNGMTLMEFAQYLVSIGADRAMNLDGGGSTTMVVREYGNQYANVVNSPSGGYERPVSATLQAVSTAPLGIPTYFSFDKKQEGKLVIGASVELETNYVLDQYYNPLSLDSSRVSYEVEGNIGVIKDNQFIAQQPGTGYIVGTYENAVKKVPVTVIDTPSKLEINPVSMVIGSGGKQQFTVKAYDQEGEKAIFDPSLVKWSVTNEIGTITQTGYFEATKVETEGKVSALLVGTTANVQVKITDKPVLVTGFNKVDQWKAENIRAASTIAGSSPGEPVYEAGSSLKLTYDLSVEDEGIAASYVTAKEPLLLTGRPTSLGAWVFGDSQEHWLRGKIIDGTGTEYTIDFTAEGGLNWSGWRYVKAEIPNGVVLPIQFTKIYIAEAYPERQGTGTLYFDKLQGEYGSSYVEPLFKDVKADYWAKAEIKYLNEKNIINGYTDGYFLPDSNLTRVHAAVLLARTLNLPLGESPDPEFNDISSDHRYYDVIASVAQYGIITGRENGTIFDPEAKLTRAQMAVILERAYELEGVAETKFNDVREDYWAYAAISALAANNITMGYKEDNTYRPENPVTRAQFSAFLYRILTKN